MQVKDIDQGDVWPVPRQVGQVLDHAFIQVDGTRHPHPDTADFIDRLPAAFDGLCHQSRHALDHRLVPLVRLGQDALQGQKLASFDIHNGGAQVGAAQVNANEMFHRSVLPPDFSRKQNEDEADCREELC